MPHNLEWAGIVSFFETITAVERRADDEYAFSIASEHPVTSKPLTSKPLTCKPLTKTSMTPEIIELRRCLSRAGWSPEPSQPAANPDPVAPALLIAVDHHAAEAFCIDVTPHDASEHVSTPHDPHHLAHRDREFGQQAHEVAGFYLL